MTEPRRRDLIHTLGKKGTDPMLERIDYHVPPPLKGDNTGWLPGWVNGTDAATAGYIAAITPPEWRDLYLAGARADGSLPPKRFARLIFPDGAWYRLEGARQDHPALGYVVRGALKIKQPGIRLEGNGATLYCETDGPGDPTNSDGKYRGGDPERVNRTRAMLDVFSQEFEMSALNINMSRRGGAVQWNCEAQHALNFAGNDTALIEDCDFTNLHGDIAWGGPQIVKDSPPSRDVTIRHCTFSNIGRQGFAPCFFKNWNITHNRGGGIKRSFVDLEPLGAGSGSSGLVVAHNEVTDYKICFVASKGANVPVRNVHFFRNLVTKAPLLTRVQSPGTDERLNVDWSFIANRSDYPADDGILMTLHGMTGLVVAFNTQEYRLDRLDANRLRRGDTAMVGLRNCDPADVAPFYNSRGSAGDAVPQTVLVA